MESELSTRGLPCRSHASNVWNVETEKINLWSGPKATSYPKQLFTKKTRKQVL